MAAFSRKNIAKALAPMGLTNTLVALRNADSYSVHRLSVAKGEVKLNRISAFEDPTPLIIGRVGMPDTKLIIGWDRSMTFYGAWFDELEIVDTDYRIRNDILGLPRDTLINQIHRDNKYGVIGSYYAVFAEILKVGKGVPMVLLDDSLLGLASFPVMIPKLSDTSLYEELAELVELFLQSRQPTPDAYTEIG